jgi:hypothetical protein
MICADFLAGANLENGNPEVLLSSLLRCFQFLPAAQQRRFLEQLRAADARRPSAQSSELLETREGAA